ncbi:MAG: hypothetical protein J6D03_10785 [Clostridia bacterium]|nr:hypothetical protein [Clostridia bacterium]
MNEIKGANYNIEFIIYKLKKGTTIDKISEFYNVSEETIMNDIKKHLKLKDEKDVMACIRQKKEFSKPVNKSIIRPVKYYKSKGYTYSEFLEMLKASNRPFSESAILLAKEIFEEDKKIKDSKNKSQKCNDEIEI